MRDQGVVVQCLTPDEVLMERARQLAVECDVPTRVRNHQVELLLFGEWMEAPSAAELAQ